MTKQCLECKKVYPHTLKNFSSHGGRCRSCARAYAKRYREEHREQDAAYQKKHREEHREQVAACQKRYQEGHREEHRLDQRRRRRELRLEVLNHYAPNGLRCACCGEDHVEFLCLDHINGGGGKHRKSIKSNLYNWLKKHGFPDGFRVLCLNCNGSLGHYDYCPHKR